MDRIPRSGVRYAIIPLSMPRERLTIHYAKGFDMKSILLTSLAVIGLAACASTGGQRQDDACATYDWQAQGVADGAAGYGEARAADFGEQCGSNFDLAAWQAGVAEGAKRFCTVEGAFRSGVARTEFRAICTPMPAGAEEALAKGERYGELTVEIADREAQVFENQAAINRLIRSQSGVTGGQTSPGSRARIGLLRDDIQRLQREIQALKVQRRAFAI